MKSRYFNSKPHVPFVGVYSFAHKELGATLTRKLEWIGVGRIFMWLRLLALLCLVLLSSRSLAQQTPIDIPFEDTSVAGSPIEVTGKISVREMIAGNQVTSRWEENVNARNISNKPILLLIGDLV